MFAGSYGAEGTNTTSSIGTDASGGSINFISHVGGKYAKGGVFDSPSLSMYSGQVVNQPTLFAFARGAGVMGEAGPEAIMPLKRGSDGTLGVKMHGAGGDIITNISVSVDANGSAKSSTSTDNSDAMARALARQMKQAAEEVVVRATQPGGILWKQRVGA